ANSRRGRPPSPAAQTRRTPAAGALASGPLEIRPLALERAAICLGAGALCPAPVTDCQLDPGLLGARPRRLDVGRRAMDLVAAFRGARAPAGGDQHFGEAGVAAAAIGDDKISQPTIRSQKPASFRNGDNRYPSVVTPDLAQRRYQPTAFEDSAARAFPTFAATCRSRWYRSPGRRCRPCGSA